MSTRTPCAGKHVLFDSTDPADHALAARLCGWCPLLDACRDRLADMRANAGYYGHPEGTWAGQLCIDGSGKNAARRLSKESRADRIATEDAAYSDAEARQAHAAYTIGDRTTWASVGHRVYDRRRKQRQRVARQMQEAS
jgi:hypothetical protein